MKLRFFISILLFVSVFISCKKDVEINPTPVDECTIPPHPASSCAGCVGVGWLGTTRDQSLNIVSGGYVYNSITEIVYIDANYTLWYLNRTTNIKKKLDVSVTAQPKMNKHGWLTYSKLNGNIYKIKINADSLTQLTFDGQSQYPAWSADGKFIYYLNQKNHGLIRIDENGINQDTLKNILSWVSITDNLMAYVDIFSGKQRILIKDLTTNIDKVIVTNNRIGNNSKDYINNVFIDNNIDKDLYWSDGYGLYKTNISTLSTTTIITACDTKYLYAFSIASDNSKIISTRSDTRAVDANYLYNEKNIYEMNTDGSNIQLITIP
ncbi:MAG: hypothetical protein ACK5QC_02975 [Bacteroidota bacterium]|jgi:hypothetical protein